MKDKNVELKREIGLLGLSANIVNIVIGAGIFVLPAIVAAGLGSASIFAYLFCGFLIVLMMLCYAEVGSKITDSGGVYTYIEKSFGRYPGFLTATLFLLATISANAAVANAIADIISKIFPFFQGEFIRILFFFFLFSGLAYINVMGVKKGVGFVKMITVLKIAPLLLIIFIGFKDVDITNLYWESIPSIKQVGESSLILFFAFTGAGSALSVSGEVRNPNKTIPRGILLSIMVVLIIYILVQTVAQGVLGSSLPLYVENPLGEVASHIFGPIGFTLLTIGAGVSMFGSLSGMILSVPRVLFAASTDRVIPIKKLSLIHNKYATPYVSIIVYASLGFLLASAGGFKQLAIISSASSLLISLGIALAVIKLRRNKDFTSDLKTFKIPGGYTIPLLSSLFILWFLYHLSEDAIMAIGFFILGLTIIYFLMNSKIIKRLTKNNRHS